MAKFYGLNEVADYWRKVVEINSWQQKRVYETIVKKLFGNLADKKIAILGFSFKENTNDTRESPAIGICRNLINEGAFLSIHDVKVTQEAIEKSLINDDFDFKNGQDKNVPYWEYQSNLYRAIENSYAVILLTAWDEYKTIDWGSVSLNVKSPFWVFDTRSILDTKNLQDLGLNIWQLGCGNNN